MSALRELRLKHNKLSQEALAEKIGTQQPQISRWELPETAAKHRKPTLGWSKKLGEFFKVDWTVFRTDIQRNSGSIDVLLQWETPETRELALRAVIEALSKRKPDEEPALVEPAADDRVRDTTPGMGEGGRKGRSARAIRTGPDSVSGRKPKSKAVVNNARRRNTRGTRPV